MNRRLRWAVALLLALMATVTRADLSSAQTTGAPGDPDDFGPFIDEFFETSLAEANIPGAVFLMVRNGDVAYARGYGVSNLEAQVPVDPERTVFRVGSNSKTFTAAAVLTLVDDGLVDLDTDVNEYLTSMNVPAAFDAPITIRNLLTHTAGLDERLFGQHVYRDGTPLSLADFLAANLTPRTSAPGRVISYNDFGTSLAGLVVEEVSGQPFAAYVADRIFSPLGMTSSSFDIANLPPPIERALATAYRYWGDEYVPYEYDFIQTAPAAGLVTTAADMGKFLSALLAGGELNGRRILSDSMTAIMLDRQFANSPRLRGRAFGFVESDENGFRGLSKDGQATGFLSRIFLLPEANIGFFASINLSIFEPGPTFNRASSFHRRLTTAFLDRYFMPDSTYFDLPEAPAPDPSFDASPYVGTYRSVEGSRHTIEKITFLGNELIVRDGGDGTVMIGGTPYVEVAPREFQYVGGGPYYAAFGGDTNQPADYLFLGAGTMERVPWRDTMRTVMIVLGTTTGVFLSAMLTWPFAGWVRRRRGLPRSARHPGRPLLLIAVSLCVVFLAGFGWFFSQTDFQDFFKGVPTSIAVLLALPVFVIPLTVVSGLRSVGAWRNSQGSLSSRLHFSIVVGALGVFLLFLHNWNMLGWRY